MFLFPSKLQRRCPAIPKKLPPVPGSTANGTTPKPAAKPPPFGGGGGGMSGVMAELLAKRKPA